MDVCLELACNESKVKINHMCELPSVNGSLNLTQSKAGYLGLVTFLCLNLSVKVSNSLSVDKGSGVQCVVQCIEH